MTDLTQWPVWSTALLGGAVIGLAASLLMLINGRIFGVSGFIRNLLDVRGQNRVESLAVLLGLGLAPLLFSSFVPHAFDNSAPRPTPYLLLAGLLVGYGTALANGCTSGHGVCGLSRMSRRSLVATLTFMGAGFLTASLIQQFGGF